MRKNDPIRNIMTTEVKSVQIGQNISDARKIMSELGVHHVPVLDTKKLVGVISTTDIMRLSFGLGSADPRQLDAVLDHTHKLKDAMHGTPVSIPEAGSVRDAAVALKDGDFHSLPVVDDNGDLAGIVTTTDLIGYLLDQY